MNISYESFNTLQPESKTVYSIEYLHPQSTTWIDHSVTSHEANNEQNCIDHCKVLSITNPGFRFRVKRVTEEFIFYSNTSEV